MTASLYVNYYLRQSIRHVTEGSPPAWPLQRVVETALPSAETCRSGVVGVHEFQGKV